MEGKTQRREGGNELALASLSTGLASLLCWCPIATGLTAVILGILHLRQSTTGRGLATIGIVTGSLAILFSLAVFGAWVWVMQQTRSMMIGTREIVGQPAPDFELPTVDGKRKVKLSDLRGKVVLLNFFAHWCGPCNLEAPHLERLWQTYRDKRVVVIGIAVWAQGDPFQRAKEFINKHQLTYPVLVDGTGEVAKRYRVAGVPCNFVVGKDGKVADVKVGADEEGIQSAIEQALRR